MFLDLLRCPDFYGVLQRFDEDFAQRVGKQGCPLCGGPLHRADFPRAPRAPIPLPEAYSRRISYCCSRKGCRTRCTPPSVRFLGRRVVVGAVVLLAAALMQGATPRRASELKRLLGVDGATLGRWRKWWLEVFPRTKTLKLIRGRLAERIDETLLPGSLLDRFAGAAKDRVLLALKQLLPLQTQLEMDAGATQWMQLVWPP